MYRCISNIMFRVLDVGVATIEFGDDPFSCRTSLK